jgi:hypothetical protein
MAEKILRMAQEEGHVMTIWGILKLLGEHEAATEVLKSPELEEVPTMQGSWLVYQQFDPRPFPALMSILERENLEWRLLAERRHSPQLIRWFLNDCFALRSGPSLNSSANGSKRPVTALHLGYRLGTFTPKGSLRLVVSYCGLCRI